MASLYPNPSTSHDTASSWSSSTLSLCTLSAPPSAEAVLTVASTPLRSRQISAVPSPGGLYSALMDMIVRLARSGLIHGDFNEFNLLIRDHRTEAEKDRDDEMPDDREARIERDGGDFPVKVELEGEEYEERKRREREGTLLEPVLIDFPQMVSTDHPDAE